MEDGGRPPSPPELPVSDVPSYPLAVDPLEAAPTPAADSSPASAIASPPPPEGPAEECQPSPPDPLPSAEALLDDASEGEEATPCSAAVLSDELRDQIVRQVEYYFSDENLPTDKFLLKFVKRDKEGFVPIALIASFRRMRKLVQDQSLIEAALKSSSKLIVSLDGKKVRRLHALSINENRDSKLRTVIVENLPQNYYHDNVQRIFGNIGNIVNITINDPHTIEGSATLKKTEIAISSKVHALVEYESVEAAETAVATLNDEKNWRSGMRVELLSKRLGKHGMFQKVDKELISKKKTDTHVGEIAPDGEKINFGEDPKVNLEGRRSRHRGRAKGHIELNSNGQGPGSAAVGSSTEFFVNKPLPGPRMPDGTKGFAMGRGRCVVSDKISTKECE